MERFWKKVTKTNSCWLWIAGKNQKGYGLFTFKNRRYFAHRFVFFLNNIEIPVEKVVDHICRVRNCVNPGHLRFVTNWENTMHGDSPIGKNVFKRQCPSGHKYDQENTAIWNRERHCRACRKTAYRKFILKNPNYERDYYLKRIGVIKA